MVLIVSQANKIESFKQKKKCKGFSLITNTTKSTLTFNEHLNATKLSDCMSHKTEFLVANKVAVNKKWACT